MPLFKDILNRRDFIDWLGGAGFFVSAWIIGKPLLKFLFPPSNVMEIGGSKIAVAKLDDIPEGRSKTVLYKNVPVLVINTRAGMAAISGVCTHLGCYLVWDYLKQQVACPCHLASFNTKGEVLSGPPPAPLSRYNVEVVNGKIYLTGFL
ncbi:MAG TPA: Rieske (2Fe-2S) protein [bacterium]